MVRAWFEVDVLPPPSSDRTTGFAFRLQTSPAEIVVHLLDRASPDNPPGLTHPRPPRRHGQKAHHPEVNSPTKVQTDPPRDKVFGGGPGRPSLPIPLANPPAVELKLD